MQQDGSSSYQVIFYLISLFKRIKDDVDKSDTVNPKEMFGNFHPELVQEIRELFQRINYQGDKEALGGLLHWKLFGNVVIFLICKNTRERPLGHALPHCLPERICITGTLILNRIYRDIALSSSNYLMFL